MTNSSSDAAAIQEYSYSVRECIVNTARGVFALKGDYSLRVFRQRDRIYVSASQDGDQINIQLNEEITRQFAAALIETADKVRGGLPNLLAASGRGEG